MKKNKENLENSRQQSAGRRSFQYSNFGLQANSQIQVKMPEIHRDFWVAAARQEKKSLSFVITELLKARYGEPDSAAPPETARTDPAVEPAVKTFDPDELFGIDRTEIL